MSVKRFALLLTCLFSSICHASFAEVHICDLVKAKDCSSHLSHHPLFDTDYKLAANYVPILALRALAHGEVYKEKKPFHIERYFYVKELTGSDKLTKAYEAIILDGEVSGFGIFNRKIKVKGTLNEHDIDYSNEMSFSLPRKALMKIKASIDDLNFLDLQVKSCGIAMTNDVEGSLFTRDVKYHTSWRDTEGILAGIKYQITATGIVKEETDFYATLEGSIGNYPIKGTVKLVKPGYYESVEEYGPILVKTFITIK
jgi:hypothetical protein